MKIDELKIVCLFFVKGENTVVIQLTKSFTIVKKPSEMVWICLVQFTDLNSLLL